MWETRFPLFQHHDTISTLLQVLHIMLSEASHIGDQAGRDLGSEELSLSPIRPTPHLFLERSGRDNNTVTREQDQQEHPASLPIKLTGYFLVTMIVPLTFGIVKTVYSYRGQAVILTTLDWFVGVFFAAIWGFLSELRAQRPGIWPHFFEDDWAPPILKFVRHPAVPPCLYSLLILSYALPTSRVFLADLRDALRLSSDPSLAGRFITIMQMNEAVVSLVLIIFVSGMGLSLAVLAILWVVQQPQVPPGFRPMKNGSTAFHWSANCHYSYYGMLFSLYAAISCSISG
ncbi:hypothetical protein BJV78DRAFT_150647 [Lactifluus subvellereus]|nr:hypothetical protein BJV78DRAFT_150647 [Lactifluus subvellereus]